MEDNFPLVSICMPAYNAEKYIGEAIKSILAQTYQNWELVIVNDGSTDATLDVINLFSDNRITVITQDNKGQCAAANKAFKVSAGEFIKFFDADDIMSPVMLSSQMALIQDNQGNIASARWGRFYNDDIKTFTEVFEPVYQDMESSEWLVQSWKNGMPMMQCGLWLIPRTIVLKAGMWDERLSLINDFDFFSRIIINSKIVRFANAATLYYRSGIENSLSGIKSGEAYKSAYLSLEKGIGTLLEKRIDMPAKTACANLWKLFLYEIYPGNQDIAIMVGKHLAKLPKPTARFPAGGLSKKLLPLLGWRLIKQLRRFKLKMKL